MNFDHVHIPLYTLLSPFQLPLICFFLDSLIWFSFQAPFLMTGIVMQKNKEVQIYSASGRTEKRAPVLWNKLILCQRNLLLEVMLF